MHVFNSIESLTKVIGDRPLNMALGNFDGVHLGHQKLIRGVVESAKNAGRLSVVVTFEPHPQQYFDKSSDFKKIDTITIRRRLLAVHGVDALLELDFDDRLSCLTAQQFLQMLATPGNLCQISVGADFRFGKGRFGDVKYLSEFCQLNGIEAIIVEPVHVGSLIASSSQIRTWLKQGHVEKAANMLGRKFILTGTVVHGQKVGRTIGFPTANIACYNQLIPGQGVYVGMMQIASDVSSQLVSNDELACVINIGRRPTVSDLPDKKFIEAHVFSPCQTDLDLYDQVIDLSFFHRLRDEKKFEDLLALKQQISLDIEHAKIKLKDSVRM